MGNFLSVCLSKKVLISLSHLKDTWARYKSRFVLGSLLQHFKYFTTPVLVCTVYQGKCAINNSSHFSVHRVSIPLWLFSRFFPLSLGSFCGFPGSSLWWLYFRFPFSMLCNFLLKPGSVCFFCLFWFFCCCYCCWKPGSVESGNRNWGVRIYLPILGFHAFCSYRGKTTYSSVSCFYVLYCLWVSPTTPSQRTVCPLFFQLPSSATLCPVGVGVRHTGRRASQNIAINSQALSEPGPQGCDHPKCYSSGLASFFPQPHTPFPVCYVPIHLLEALPPLTMGGWVFGLQVTQGGGWSMKNPFASAGTQQWQGLLPGEESLVGKALGEFHNDSSPPLSSHEGLFLSRHCKNLRTFV